jgi:type I restriction enzyme M protein
LQHFIKMLKAGGRAGVVIKNTFSVEYRQRLGEPAQTAAGKLQPAHGPGLPRRHVSGRWREDRGAVFREGSKVDTRRTDAQVWYYQLDPGRNLGKTNPLNDADLAEFVELQKT